MYDSVYECKNYKELFVYDLLSEYEQHQFCNTKTAIDVDPYCSSRTIVVGKRVGNNPVKNKEGGLRMNLQLKPIPKNDLDISKYILVGKAASIAKVRSLNIPFKEVDPIWSTILSPANGKPVFAAVKLAYNKNTIEIPDACFAQTVYGTIRYEALEPERSPWNLVSPTPPIHREGLKLLLENKNMFQYGLMVWECKTWKGIESDPVILGVYNDKQFLLYEWELTPQEEEFFK